jgi:hypothetical protein
VRVVVWQATGDDGETVWRLREPTGALVESWAPGIENPDPLGALDRGGFDQRNDAKAFALGIDRWRAEVGLIAETVADIDIERHALDSYGGGQRKALDERPEPVVMHRRRPAA